MTFFVCLVDPLGHAVPYTLRAKHEVLPKARGLPFSWQTVGGLSILIAGSQWRSESLVAIDGGSIIVGSVRLDNREEVVRHLSGSRGHEFTDLELALASVARSGVKCISRFLGDFAFVVWNAAARVLIAARDPFGLKQLYYTEENGLFAFASRAEALGHNSGYETQYLAEMVAVCNPSPRLTVYTGVHPLPEATTATFLSGKLYFEQYWSPSDFEQDPVWLRHEDEAAEVCRRLLAESVRLRVGGSGETWAQLSGGIDSSSVVSVAQWLVEQGAIGEGLAGTVTYVDREASAADERHYSNVVVSRWGVRNETIIDSPIWSDGGDSPPYLDQPRFGLPFYPRERRLRALVREAGGRVLLTGVGGDELFSGTMLFFADQLAHGHIVATIREMALRAAVGRVSFWNLAFRNAFLPLLPRYAQQALGGNEIRLPPWIQRPQALRYRLAQRRYVAASYAGPAGHKYRHALITYLMGIGRTMEFEVIEDALDVRHPFLHRPLVEFALRLPPELCVRPYQRKWVLRESMRGILPETVRTRVGKGSPQELYARSLATQRSLLEPLVREPILADLGVVDGGRLRAAFDASPSQSERGVHPHGTLHATLAIEAWLQLRAGRWPRGTTQAALDQTLTNIPSTEGGTFWRDI